MKAELKVVYNAFSVRCTIQIKLLWITHLLYINPVSLKSSSFICRRVSHGVILNLPVKSNK